jgi:hypothetical protein
MFEVGSLASGLPLVHPVAGVGEEKRGAGFREVDVGRWPWSGAQGSG